MFSPGAVYPAAGTTLVLALLLPVSSAAADDHPYRTEALAGTYRYNPAEPKPEPGPAPAVAEPAGRPRKRVVNPAERLPEKAPPPSTPPIGSATLTADGTLVFPKMSVNAPKPKLPATLPQLYVRPPVRKDLGDGDPFETPAGRAARLIKTYYTPGEQKLAKWTLNSVGGWAVRDAAINDTAAQLNDIATLLDLSVALGIETPEEQKKLRNEYMRALAEKPR